MVRGSKFIVGTLWAQLLLQFSTNSSEILQVSLSWAEDVHVLFTEKVRENSRECHNHKPQPFPDSKRKRKPTNLIKHKPNKRTKSTKISSLFPKRGNRNTKRTERHKNKVTHGKTYNKSPRRINHKATKSKTNTGTTAWESLIFFFFFFFFFHFFHIFNRLFLHGSEFVVGTLWAQLLLEFNADPSETSHLS